MIDLTKGDKTFVVPTSVIRNNRSYMGPDVKVNARDSEHAKQVVQEAGHTPNSYFFPKEVKNNK